MKQKWNARKMKNCKSCKGCQFSDILEGQPCYLGFKTKPNWPYPDIPITACHKEIVASEFRRIILDPGTLLALRAGAAKIGGEG